MAAPETGPTMDDIRLASDLCELVFPGSSLPGTCEKLKSGGSMGTGMPAFFMAKNGSDLWISVRGAAEPADFLLVCQFERVPFLTTCTAHKGVLAGARYIIQQCRAQIDATLAAGGRVLSTGHSLGGATAGMITAVLALEEGHRNAAGVCFAMFPILDQEASRRLEPYVTSFVFRNDVVPRLNARNVTMIVDFFGGPQMISQLQFMIGQWLQSIAQQAMLSMGMPMTNIDLTQQIPEVVRQLMSLRSETREFFLPGRVFYIDFDQDGLGVARPFTAQDSQINIAAWMMAMGDHNGQFYQDIVMTLETL